VFSFHPVKVITSAEGGMALTNDEQLAQRMALLRSHGMTRDAALMDHQPDGPWYYEQVDLGFNYRMTDVQAALGLSQLTRLEACVQRRHELARRYDERLASLPVTGLWQHPDSYSGLHLYVVRVEAQRHRAVFDAMRAADIGVNLHYIPVYRQPYYRQLGTVSGTFPESERYYAEAISLPMYPTLREAEQDRVIDALRKAVTA
jgi:dTDP-4-amino-4,6-dideoxygalactose transaminase